MSPAAQNNQNCDSHPITVHIPTVQHGLFAIKSLLRQAEESTDLALTNLREMNITLAATALECGQNYANIGVKTLDYLTENIDHDLQQNEEAVRLAKAGEALDQRLDEVGDAINRAIGPIIPGREPHLPPIPLLLRHPEPLGDPEDSGRAGPSREHRPRMVGGPPFGPHHTGRGPGLPPLPLC